MKKFFLIAAAAVVAFASCSKNESPVVENQDKAIGFNTYTGRAVTKADDTFIPKSQTWLNQGKAFGVYAYNTLDVPFTGTQITKVFMDDEPVTFNGSSATEAGTYVNYRYTNKKYWPNDEDNNLLTFWAYYPQGALTKGFEANDFTVKTVPAQMVDLLLADVKEDQTYTKAKKEGTVGVVPFTFHHALTMVKFKVVAAEDYGTTTIILNNLTIKAKKSGTVTPSFTAASGDTPSATAFTWAATGDVADFVLATNVEVKKAGAWLPSNTAASTTTAGNDQTGSDATTTAVDCPAEDAFLMIPQDLVAVVNGNDQANAEETPIVTAVIKYTVKSADGTEVENNVTVGLKTADVAVWAQNKNIVYTFTIGLKPIEFTATVADWADEVTTGITIN